MGARWLVQTRGPGATEDYRWVPVGHKNLKALRLLEKGWRKGSSFLTLLDDERPGLLLYRFRSEGLLLLITGLIPAGRPVDSRKRAIRVNVLGCTHDSADRLATDSTDSADDGTDAILAIACAALRGDLSDRLPVVYGSDGGSGFALEPEDWNDMLEDVKGGPTSSDTSPARGPRVDNDTETARARVAGELAAVHSQGTLDRLSGTLLVLRTGVLSRRQSEALGAWRVLVDILPDEQEPAEQNLFSQFRDLRNRLGIPLFLGLVALAVVVAAIVANLPMWDTPPGSPATSPATSPTASTPLRPPSTTGR
ncbi:hypothetical protein FXF51_20910 [Nonomuraea sp. PA05]|uniref:hypothetical protein n=1 Tax=Nonomuraea sp. PA05 TaxID=2604466 RepID=UPI0011DC0BF3|nr:hypothetical protein [Nonomuraea sp. PA05]TYB64903.1 hypothetical protein FXF51_20910 [Nonomuraea sp. PA05]